MEFNIHALCLRSEKIQAKMLLPESVLRQCLSLPPAHHAPARAPADCRSASVRLLDHSTPKAGYVIRRCRFHARVVHRIEFRYTGSLSNVHQQILH